MIKTLIRTFMMILGFVSMARSLYYGDINSGFIGVGLLGCVVMWLYFEEDDGDKNDNTRKKI